MDQDHIILLIWYVTPPLLNTSPPRKNGDFPASHVSGFRVDRRSPEVRWKEWQRGAVESFPENKWGMRSNYSRWIFCYWSKLIDFFHARKYQCPKTNEKNHILKVFVCRFMFFSKSLLISETFSFVLGWCDRKTLVRCPGGLGFLVGGFKDFLGGGLQYFSFCPYLGRWWNVIHMYFKRVETTN